MARYADINGYPGPRHVLDLREELELEDEQAKQMEAIYEEMAEKARMKGEAIVAAEKRLNGLFLGKTASVDSVRSLTEEIGRLRGELRAIHLLAHMQASAIMSPAQRERYSALRRGMHGHGH
jgi:Spy/CpxP family protein refolding chaperone